jgi:adenylate kinase
MQGRMFADEYGYAWISTGELFRVLVTGQRRQQMLEGKLLSDKEVIKLIDRTLRQLIDTDQEFLLDGFPRTQPQADWLLEQVKQGRFQITAIFNLKATPDIVKKRLLNRGRQDDTAAAIKKRFEEYETTTLPIINHFKRAGIKVIDVDGDRDPALVHNDIMRHIGKDERANQDQDQA